MKIKFILLSFFIIVLNNTVFSQQPDPLSFFPSGVGNVWEYNTPDGIEKLEIVTDSLRDGLRYVYYADFFPGRALYEIDSLNSFIHYDPEGLNWLKYKLDADSGECWTYVPGIDRDERVGRVDTIYTAVVFGKERVIKEVDYYFVGVVPFKIAQPTAINRKNSNFFHSIADSGYICGNDITCYCFDIDTPYTYESTIVLVEGIGEYYEYTADGGPQRILRGAVIDGDTLGIITSVKENSFEIPDGFQLSQNYPNPFNPSTKIEYYLSEGTQVKLTVYNLLGQKIKTLVDEFRSPGKYEVIFSASSVAGGLSSGVYLYTISAGKYFSSKKMIIAK